MRAIVLSLFLFTMAAMAIDIVFYNPVSYPVANRVTRYAVSLDESQYVGATNALIITNAVAQRGVGVTMSNITLVCVVDGQQVRLITEPERQSYTNWVYTNGIAAAERTKYEAREYATNIVNGTDGIELFIRAKCEADWFFINQIRTNLSRPALSKTDYLLKVQEFINSFGQ